MCDRTKAWTYGMLIVTSLLLGIAGAACGQEPALGLFGVSDLVRVFEDGYDCPAAGKAIDVFGIRGECISAQCVVKVGRDLGPLTARVSPLRHAESGVSLPSDCLRWNFVGSITIEENSPNRNKEDLIRAAPGLFPDYLAEEEEAALKKGQCKAIWLTIRIPPDARAGDYTGNITVATKEEQASLPVQVRVYPLTLPEQRHLMVTEWYSTGRFRQFHGVDSSDSEAFYEMLGVYAENMAEHRQNVFRVSLDLITAREDASGRLAFDFSRFDRWAEVFWNTGGMDLLETGFVARFGEGGWSSREVVLRDFRVYKEATKKSVTVPGREYLPKFLPALEEHLREKGWLEKTVFHIADEPSNHNVMPWREASQFVHEHGPALRRMDAIETTHCRDRLEVWVPKLDHLATWMDAYEEARGRGNELWFYTVGIYQGGSLPNKTVDVPLIESRILHWINYRFGLKGYLHWGFNSWTDDPFGAPGKHRGDGWHVYPKKEGLLNSLRWEQMRNGIEDYEYLWMLEEKIRAIKKTLDGRVSELIEPSRRPAEIACRIVRTIHQYDKGPKTLYAAKKQVIEELLDLEKSPRMIVQTNPIEYSAVAANCAVDVFGWAEAGTKVTINGTAAPVAADGLFMDNVRLSQENTIVVQAQHNKGTKKVVRFFEAVR